MTLPNLRKRAYREGKPGPTTIWSHVGFSWWGSPSAMRANRWLSRTPPPLDFTITRDPWWKRLWTWLRKKMPW